MTFAGIKYHWFFKFINGEEINNGMAISALYNVM